MGRKPTTEVFTTLRITLDQRMRLSKHKFGTEPLHITLNRILTIYNRDEELVDAQYMVNYYQKEMQRMKKEIDQLKSQRRTMQIGEYI